MFIFKLNLWIEFWGLLYLYTALGIRFIALFSVLSIVYVKFYNRNSRM